MKNLIFHNAADDSYMNTAENFRGAFASTQTVDIYFQAAGAGVASPGAFDKITVACTNGEEDRAVEQLAAAMTSSKVNIVVADDVNSVYACQDIISVTTIALAGIGQTFRVPTESVTVNDTLLASESGKTFVFADAAAVLTLPDSGGGNIIGTTYKFISNFTGTGQEVICADTTNEFFIGTIIGADQDADASPLGWNAQVSDGFSSIEFTGVTDGKIGSYFTVTCYAADRWLIEGVVAQSGGSEATPFAAS